ncbi:hypothetical protein [Salibacterium lacus]|uniref:Uncharacterized protein n=1 Tax=Salibacterium lacus TaxID=1898109 RepID=A0ABW5SXJ6_9BACI
MKVFYEEIDGGKYPQMVFLPADLSDHATWFKLQGPFEEIPPEDLHEDLKVLTITIGELIRDPCEDNSFGVSTKNVLKLCDDLEIPDDQLQDIDYLAVYMDALEEVMQLDVREKLL